MPIIRTRAAKGAVLTHAEGDANMRRGAKTIDAVYTARIDDNRDTLVVTEAVTITLGVASTLLSQSEPGDYRVTVKNAASGNVTVSCSGSDTIDGAASVVLAPNGSVTLVAVAGGYLAVGSGVIAGTGGTQHRNNDQNDARFANKSTFEGHDHTGGAGAQIPAGGIASNAVTTAKILDANVTEAKIANNAVTANKIANNAVTEAKINAGAVTEGKIGTGAVTVNKIGAGAVTTSKIGDGQVTDAKLVQFEASTARLAAAYPEIESFVAPVGVGSAVVKATFLVLRGGTLTARARCRKESAADNWQIRWAKNGSGVGSSIEVSASMANYDANISVAAGDYLELLFWRSGNQSVGLSNSFEVEAVELRTSAASLQGGALALPMPYPNTGL